MRPKPAILLMKPSVWAVFLALVKRYEILETGDFAFVDFVKLGKGESHAGLREYHSVFSGPTME